MSHERTHAALSRAAEDWLIWLSDPAGTRRPPREAIEAQEFNLLLLAAEMHGTLPCCLEGLKRADVADAIVNNGGGMVGATQQARANRGIELIAVQMNLHHQGQRAERALAERGLPFLRVKGQTFAERLYPLQKLRGYTDVDLLIPTRLRGEVGETLERLGFTYHDAEYRKGEDYFEDKWTLTNGPHEVLIEVHGNLVHNPRLRQNASLEYDDVLEAGDGDGTEATALLLVAATHGSASHQFDRLQHVVDVVQGARGAAGPIAVDRLRKVAERCGLMFPVVAALRLAGETFQERRCDDLIAELAPTRFVRAASGLLNGRVVIGAQSDQRSRFSWRRKLFRQALRASARRTRSTAR